MGDEDVRVVYSEVGANLWVCAPSLDLPPEENRGIVTTENSDRYYRNFNGTSASVPIVFGRCRAAARVNTELTWRDLKLILAASARKNDPDNPGWKDGAVMYDSDSLLNVTTSTPNNGFGMVDAGSAVELAKEWNNLPPLFESASGDIVGRLIPDVSELGTVPRLLKSFP